MGADFSGSWLCGLSLSAKMLKAAVQAVFLLPLLFISFSCFRQKTGPERRDLLINGGGASFPYILYSKWALEYKKIVPSVSINYQSIGSAGGVRQFFKGTLDFGATDVPVPPKEIKAAGKPLEHIPAALSAVAITYNLDLPEGQALRLSGEVLAEIFMGKIKTWNHPKLQALNRKIPLPAEPIVAVYRADGSGGTAFFTEYLSKASKEFLEQVGKGKSVNWPVGVGGKGNEGVLGLVSKMKGSLAYIARSYALTRRLPMAKIENRRGRFVLPTEEAIKSAASISMGRKKPLTVSLINADGEKAYPMAGFTYIILSPKMPKRKKEALTGFLMWALGPGQAFSNGLRFVPLPEEIRKAAIGRLSRMRAE